MGTKPRIVLLGKQGAGKGTQANLLARHYEIAHLSTGDMFRAQASAGTAFGLEAKRYMDAGELVPDDSVMGVVEECLAPGGPMSDGFILDGFPRTQGQAEELGRVLDGRPLDAVVHIDVPREVVVERLSERRVCERDSSHIYSVSSPPKVNWTCDVCGGKVVQRPDDTPEAIERRLDAYEQETRPIREFYRESGLPVVTIDGVGPTDEVFARLTDAIDGILE
ncbi:MAG TPA: adenylate kinase [Acidimicrobiia bacterium]